MQSGCAKSRRASCKSTRFDLQVDIVLSDDRGFWSAIETFMSISKRPIVMTASDRYFVSRFPCRVELLTLHTPQHVCSVDFFTIGICLCNICNCCGTHSVLEIYF